MLNKTEKIGYGLIGITLILSLYLGFTNQDYFNQVFAAEDKLVESGTAIMLLFISILCFYRLLKISKTKSITWKIGICIFAVLFLFAAGEEISWGQRIFNIQSSNFFLNNNAQQETNLHNLVVGDQKINKLVFSQLIMVVMILYLLVVPILYRRVKWIKNLADMFAIPITKWHQTIAFIIATVIISIIPPDRKWEVYELVFGMMFFLIFLFPLNSEIYDINKKAD